MSVIIGGGMVRRDAGAGHLSSAHGTLLVIPD